MTEKLYLPITEKHCVFAVSL